MKVYVSGRITDEENYREQFDAVAARLRAGGHDVVNPVELDDAEAPLKRSWEGYMRRDLIAMLTDCEAIYMLPTWSQSPGARLEHDVAQRIGMKVVYGWDER